jgi:DNA-binding beta-propeller fold protein YncE
MFRAIGAQIALATLVISVAGAAVGRAAPVRAPIELVPSGHSGWQVNGTTGGNVCTVSSKDECRPGESSSEAGGFSYLNSVTVDPRTGNVYVADSANNRVQELTATGAFVAMFGWDVNETKTRQATSSQAEENVCTGASGDMCTAGVQGTAAGQLAYPAGVAVAPTTGDVYVLEISSNDFRVDKFTAGGRFVWTIGREVNTRTRGSICTEREVEQAHVRCKAGVENSTQSIEPGAFKYAQADGNLLAVGGPGELLYVGDEHRVQEFDAEGRWKGEILLASLSPKPQSVVSALALDKRGDLYLVYHVAGTEDGVQQRFGVIREFNPAGEQVAAFPVNPSQPNATISIVGLAIDSSDHLAVVGGETGGRSFTRIGLLYDARTGRPLTSFPLPTDNDGIAFNGDGDLYIAATDDQEVVAYAPRPMAALLQTLVACEIGIANDPSIAFNCALEDEVSLS